MSIGRGVGSLTAVLGFLTLFVVAASFLAPTQERPVATPSLGSAADPSSTYDPFRSGEEAPPGYRQVLPRDAILPVYDPTFVTPDDTGWSGDSLVIGLEIDGQARAYPVAFLNRREMVVDSVAGVPVLVTW